MAELSAAILAGGKNIRMKGRNKAFIPVGGIPIVQRSLGVLRKIFKETIIVTNSPRDFAAFEKESIITVDLIKNRGPLGGIYSALSVTTRKAVFFVACDMPNLHKALILRLVNYFQRSDFDVVVPRINSFIEPLHGIYRKELNDRLRVFLGTGKDYSVRSFLRTVNVGYLDLEDNLLNRKIFSNLNTPQDLKDWMEGGAWK